MTVDIKELLKAGAHFGHQKQKWNPKMAPYIFTERNGVHIINLQKTVDLIDRAGAFLRSIGERGEEVLLVGTKRQAQEVIRAAAERAGLPYVNYRWLGGMLTNFQTIIASINRLKKYEEMLSEERRVLYTKKELISIAKEKAKLERNLSGIVTMTKIPSAVFVVDPVREHIAVHEANKLGLPIVAIIDTNGDPDLIDYPIPANDDGMRVIEIIVNELVSCYADGHNLYKQKIQSEEKDRKDHGVRRDETHTIAGRKVRVKRIVTESDEEEKAGDGAPDRPARRTAKKEAVVAHETSEKKSE